ncbi:hypothetical protein ACOSQ3_002886 [Xanthoceras sorbifolium]
MIESFNSMVGEHRAKTYLCLLEHIRRIPTMNAKIIKASRNSRLLKMLSTKNGEYELLGETRAYVTKLNFCSCECGAWQISGVSCSHTLARIGHYLQHMDGIVEFVHPSLTKTAF